MEQQKKEFQSTWKPVNSKKLDLENGHKVVVGSQVLINETGNETEFYVIKKWKTDSDGVSFKPATKFFIQKRFWNDVVKAIKDLDLPN